MSYQHEDYSEAEDWTVMDLLMAIAFSCILVGIMIALGCAKPKSQGYGGSPGHMSPVEVEELYKKNQKP